MKIVLFANTDWYLYNFRRSLALRAVAAGHEVVLVSPDGAYGARLRELGLRWIPAPMERRSLNPLQELKLVLWLRRLIQTERADIVHGFTIKSAIYGALAARLAGAASVNAVAGMGYVFISDSFTARVLRPLVRSLMRLVFGGLRSRLVLQNSDDVDLFLRSGIVRREQIRLIPGSGVNCGKFKPCVGHQREKPPTVVLAARLLWDKGVGEFVEAARLLRAKGCDARFLLAGAPDAGNPASIPEEKLKHWQLEGIVEWLGHVEDMPSLLANADIVALPSYREGLPKSLIEAAACGRPLIATDVPGCRAVVTNGVNGLLIPVRNAGALAGAVERLLDDPEFAAQLGKAARAKALAEYDERLIVERTMEVYSEIVTVAK